MLTQQPTLEQYGVVPDRMKIERTEPVLRAFVDEHLANNKADKMAFIKGAFSFGKILLIKMTILRFCAEFIDLINPWVIAELIDWLSTRDPNEPIEQTLKMFAFGLIVPAVNCFRLLFAFYAIFEMF